MFGVPQNTILRELSLFPLFGNFRAPHLQSLFSFELTQTSPVNSLFPEGEGSGLQKTISGNHLISLQVPEVMMITVGADKELNKIFKKAEKFLRCL